jgi:hypothetical protein
MPHDPTLPPSLAAEIADLKRRLSNLERSPSLPFSSFKGGALLFLDNDGNVRRAMGNVAFDGSVGGVTEGYGDYQYGDDQAVIVAAQEGDRGIVYPTQPIPMLPITAITVTSGTFTGLFEHRYDMEPAYEVIRIQMAASTGAGTTGEIRLNDSISGQSTSAASIPALTNGIVDFMWLHPAAVGLFDAGHARESIHLSVQARLTGGAGGFSVFPPRVKELGSVFLFPDAATNGNPVVT